MMKIGAYNVVASRPPERQGSPATTIARANRLMEYAAFGHVHISLWVCVFLLFTNVCVQRFFVFCCGNVCKIIHYIHNCQVQTQLASSA